MAEWYIQPCDRCGGAIRRGERQVDTAGWAHDDPEKCRSIIEADLRTRIAASVLKMEAPAYVDKHQTSAYREALHAVADHIAHWA